MTRSQHIPPTILNDYFGIVLCPRVSYEEPASYKEAFKYEN